MTMTRIGRLARQHGADLHRRGLRAQHRRRQVALRGKVERVVVGAGGMMRRDVQRAEIQPVGFHVGTLGDLAAHGAEDRGNLLHGAADRVDQAGLARARRQGRVEAFGGQAGVKVRGFQRNAARFDESGERVLELVQRGAPFPALVGRGLAKVTQQRRQAAVAAQRGDADGVPGAQVGGGGQSGLGFSLQGGEVVGHFPSSWRGCCIVMAGVVASSWPGSTRPSPPAKCRDGWPGQAPAKTRPGDYSAACTFLTISAKLAESS